MTKDSLVVPSKSRYDLLMQRHEYNHDAVMENLVFDDVRANVLDGHHAQKRNLEFLTQLFGREHVLSDRSLLTSSVAAHYRYVIAAGGDEHFCWVAHWVGNTPLIGYVLDERRSTGALLSYSRQNLEPSLEHLVRKDYQLQQWTKIRVSLNGVQVEPGVSFYSFGETDADDNSRQKILYRGKAYDFRCSSGIHVTTGAGSTGWYRQLHQDIYGCADVFDKERRRLVAFVRESGKDERKFVIEPADTLSIVSYYDASGKARPDAIKELTYPFAMGSIADITVAQEYLNVVSPP